MVYDANLELDAGRTVTADESTNYIEAEGGALMWACLKMGAMSGTTPTFDARVQHSPDGGTTYYMAGKHQRFADTDDDKFSRIPVYIPRPETKGAKVRVRMNYDVGGTSPSFAVTKAWLEPMLSLAPEATDESLLEGAALQMAAV